MDAPELSLVARTARCADAIAAACDAIAPNWPLDRAIAVNPFWGWIGQPAPVAAARLGALCGTRLTLPRALARDAWTRGLLRREHLLAAAQQADAVDPSHAADRLQALLEEGAAGCEPDLLPLLADLAAGPVLHPAIAPADAVVHQVSQHCAAWADDGQAAWRPDTTGGLWPSWREHLAHEHGVHWQRGHGWLLQALAQWPQDAREAIAHGLHTLRLPQQAWAAYLTALLLRMNGWAAWCAWRRWEARLAGGDDDTLVQLLAVRVAWEALLQEDQDVLQRHPAWPGLWAGHTVRAASLEAQQRDDWLLQHAMELAYQQPLVQALARPAAPREGEASVQAVFCIDVRSERMRRALETADPSVHTRGFAGFFGLPIAWRPAGSDLLRPQLPGLLAPTLEVGAEDATLGQVLRRQRQRALGWRARWAGWRAGAGSAFSFVETCGLAYAAKLVRAALPSTDGPSRWEHAGLDLAGKPRLPEALAASVAGIELAEGVLRAMGLVRDFAPLVLLAGHGSQSANNPHAAGLDCGACGGQTGEVNARALAGLLNDTRVRSGLAARGIAIPAQTWFVPGLHNTTTDDVVLHDLDEVPRELRAPLAALQRTLAQAGDAVRAERAPSLGLPADLPHARLAVAMRQRANNWAQVRPEWGLADNAAFVIAPRSRTRALALDGRVFLHDYDWRDDAEGRVLTLLMTAPMVVTHWINMQYHASTVDNPRWGSGNKLLHNVVGGHLGVFEGNGGDLRVGLPLQSLHDGTRWRHTPLRLSVFIEAPAAAIDAVLQGHETVRHLVQHGWLHLLRIDPAQPLVERWTPGGWTACAPPVA